MSRSRKLLPMLVATMLVGTAVDCSRAEAPSLPEVCAAPFELSGPESWLADGLRNIGRGTHRERLLQMERQLASPGWLHGRRGCARALDHETALALADDARMGDVRATDGVDAALLRRTIAMVATEVAGDERCDAHLVALVGLASSMARANDPFVYCEAARAPWELRMVLLRCASSVDARRATSMADALSRLSNVWPSSCASATQLDCERLRYMIQAHEADASCGASAPEQDVEASALRLQLERASACCTSEDETCDPPRDCELDARRALALVARTIRAVAGEASSSDASRLEAAFVARREDGDECIHDARLERALCRSDGLRAAGACPRQAQ